MHLDRRQGRAACQKQKSNLNGLKLRIAFLSSSKADLEVHSNEGKNMKGVKKYHLSVIHLCIPISDSCHPEGDL